MYTRAIFRRFYEEFLQSLSERISGTTFDGFIYEYTLKCDGIQSEHVVRFNPTDFSVSCECKLFESKGWLCRHALHILNGNISVSAIPSSYVLKRWTKGAKQGYVNDESHEISPGPSTFNRFSALMQSAFEVMSLGAQDENTMRIAKKNLKATVAEIASYNSSVTMTNDASDDDNNEASLSEMPILDPLRRKGKEPIYGRLKSSSEKKKKKSKKQTPPMPIKNQELAVQAMPDETYVPNFSINSTQIRNVFCPSNIGGPIVSMQPQYAMPPGIINGFSSFPSQVQPPYIMRPANMDGFSPFASQMQTPYIMPQGIINKFSPFTNQMLEYHNRSPGINLSQGSSNSFQHPEINELNNS